MIHHIWIICRLCVNTTSSVLIIFLFLSLVFSPGVVSVSFEEDEEGNLCLIAYPIHSDPADLENKELSADGEPKNKLVMWGKKKPSGLLPENERARQSRKEEKGKR